MAHHHGCPGIEPRARPRGRARAAARARWRHSLRELPPTGMRIDGLTAHWRDLADLVLDGSRATAAGRPRPPGLTATASASSSPSGTRRAQVGSEYVGPNEFEPRLLHHLRG